MIELVWKLSWVVFTTSLIFNLSGSNSFVPISSSRNNLMFIIAPSCKHFSFISTMNYRNLDQTFDPDFANNSKWTSSKSTKFLVFQKQSLTSFLPNYSRYSQSENWNVIFVLAFPANAISIARTRTSILKLAIPFNIYLWFNVLAQQKLNE